MGALLLSPVGRVLVGAVVGAGLVAGVYLYAYHRGASGERAAALQRSVDLIRERTKTDDRIKGLDDAALCRALGGVPVDGGCQ